LTPFDDFTKFVSGRRPYVYIVASLYKKLENLLTNTTKIRGEFKGINQNLTKAAKVGIEKFKEYHDLIKLNHTYYITAILDPRIKTNWIKKNVQDANNIINEIKDFLKKAYTLD
jgi:hypothetical protein